MNKPKTIDEVCMEPPGSFTAFILARNAAGRMIRPMIDQTPMTFTALEINALLRAIPELRELGESAHQ